jgi:hypothetical protein
MLCSQLDSPKKAQTVAGRKRFRYLTEAKHFLAEAEIRQKVSVS